MRLKLIASPNRQTSERAWVVSPRHLAILLGSLPGTQLSEEVPEEIVLFAQLETLAAPFSTDQLFMEQFKEKLSTFKAINYETKYFSNKQFAKKFMTFIALGKAAIQSGCPKRVSQLKVALGLYPISANFKCKGGGMTEIEKAILHLETDAYQTRLTNAIDDFVARRHIARHIQHHIYEMHIPKGLRILLGGHRETILEQDENHSLGMINDIPHTCVLELWRHIQDSFNAELKFCLPDPTASLCDSESKRFEDSGFIPAESARELMTPLFLTPERLPSVLSADQNFNAIHTQLREQLGNELQPEDSDLLFETVARRLLEKREDQPEPALIEKDGQLVFNPNYDWDNPIDDISLSIKGQSFTIESSAINSFIFSLSKVERKEKHFQPVEGFVAATEALLKASPLGLHRSSSETPRKLHLEHQEDLYGENGAHYVETMATILSDLMLDKPVHSDDIAETLIILRSELENMRGSQPLLAYAVIDLIGLDSIKALEGHDDVFVSEQCRNIRIKFENFKKTLAPSTREFLEMRNQTQIPESNANTIITQLVQKSAPLFMLRVYQRQFKLTDTELATKLFSEMMQLGANRTLAKLNWSVILFVYEHCKESRKDLSYVVTDKEISEYKLHNSHAAFDRGLHKLIDLELKELGEQTRWQPETSSRTQPHRLKELFRAIRPNCKHCIDTYLNPSKHPDTAFSIEDILPAMVVDDYPIHPHYFFIMMTIMTNYPLETDKTIIQNIAKQFTTLKNLREVISREPKFYCDTLKRICKSQEVDEDVKSTLLDAAIEACFSRDGVAVSQVLTPDFFQVAGRTLIQPALKRYRETILLQKNLRIMQHLMRPDNAIIIGAEFMISTFAFTPNCMDIPRLVAMKSKPALTILFSEDMKTTMGPERYRAWLAGESLKGADGEPVDAPTPSASEILANIPTETLRTVLFSAQTIYNLGPELYLILLKKDQGALLKRVITEPYNPTDKPILTSEFVSALGDLSAQFFEMELDPGKTVLNYEMDPKETACLANPALWRFIPETRRAAFFTADRLATFMKVTVNSTQLPHPLISAEAQNHFEPNQYLEAFKIAINKESEHFFSENLAKIYLLLKDYLKAVWKNPERCESLDIDNLITLLTGDTDPPLYLINLRIYSMLELFLANSLTRLEEKLKTARTKTKAEREDTELRTLKSKIRSYRDHLNALHDKTKKYLKQYGIATYNLETVTSILGVDKPLTSCESFQSSNDLKQGLVNYFSRTKSKAVTEDIRESYAIALRIEFTTRHYILIKFYNSDTDLDELTTKLEQFKRAFPVKKAFFYGDRPQHVG